MEISETDIYYTFKVNKREYHYPKAVWSFEGAKKDLETYLNEYKPKNTRNSSDTRSSNNSGMF